MAPKGKGRILHLGAYLSKDGKPVEILDAPKEKDGSFSRSNWNTKTSQIKVSVLIDLRLSIYVLMPKAACN